MNIVVNVISLLIAVAQAIPKLSSLCIFLIMKLEAYQSAKANTTAYERLEAKNKMVDDAVSNVQSNRLSNINLPIEQQSKINESK